MKNSKQYVTEINKSLDFWLEVSVIEFTEELARIMDELSITQAELARRIDKKPSYVSRVLSGNVNFTLKTMTRLALALDSIVHTHLAPKNAQVHWLDEYSVKYNAGLEESDDVTQSMTLTPFSTATGSSTYSGTINFLEVNNL